MPVMQVQSSTQPYDASTARRLGTWRALGRKLDAREGRDDLCRSGAREAASLLTSQLFFVPLLAEMRKLPFGKEFGHGGRMEDALGEQLDLRIADTVARSDRSLTPQLAEKLIRKQAPPNPDWRPVAPERQRLSLPSRAADAGGDR